MLGAYLAVPTGKRRKARCLLVSQTKPAKRLPAATALSHASMRVSAESPPLLHVTSVEAFSPLFDVEEAASFCDFLRRCVHLCCWRIGPRATRSASRRQAQPRLAQFPALRALLRPPGKKSVPPFVLATLAACCVRFALYAFSCSTAHA